MHFKVCSGINHFKISYIKTAGLEKVRQFGVLKVLKSGCSSVLGGFFEGKKV